MTPALVAGLESELIEMLRETVLLGSPREIPATEPLGGDALGVDSLGFVTFLSAAESRFDVAIPDEVWLERGRLTVRDLAVWIGQAARASVPAAPPRDASPSLWRRIARRIHARERFHVLSFDLQSQPLPSPRVPRGVAVRAAVRADIGSTHGLWPAHVEERNRAQFLARLDEGHCCHVAIADGRIAAMTWATTHEDLETMTGLVVRPTAGAYYAFDLNVHPAYAGLGIGDALLAFELHEAKRKGLRAGHTIVRTTNHGMLALAGAIGFRRTGEIETRRILSRPFSRWQRGDRKGRRTLPLDS